MRLSRIERESLMRSDKSVPYVVRRSNLVRQHLTTVMKRDMFEGYYTDPVIQPRARSSIGSRGHGVMTPYASSKPYFYTGRKITRGILFTQPTVNHGNEDEGGEDE